MTIEKAYSGGCQCGAVRYRVTGPLTNAHLCHCRMCQKAAGNYFMALANARKKDFETTRGEISYFQTSAIARRGFCKDCGTPLIYDGLKSKHLNITLGSLDDPTAIEPVRQMGVEARMPWFSHLHKLPATVTDEGFTPAQLQEVVKSRRTHPDLDTDEWPPR
jgi:hypothetical protein